MEGQTQNAWWVVGRRAVMAAGLAVFLLGAPLLVSAQTKKVIINELMWGGLEYVELYNSTDEAVSLSGWSLTRQQAGEEEKKIIEFDAEDVVPAQAYYLIEEKEEATSVVADKVTSKLVLVNGGELVVLWDKEGKVVDEANRTDKWFAGESAGGGLSMERKSDGEVGTEASSWYSSTGEVGGRRGTPGEENSAPEINTPPEAIIEGPSDGVVGEELVFTAEDSEDQDGDKLSFVWEMGDGETRAGEEVKYQYKQAGVYTVTVAVSDGEAEAEASGQVSIVVPKYSDKVVINELLPNPVGSDSEGEFIELKNIGEEAVDLSGWQLDDKEGGSAPYTIGEVIINSGDILLFKRPETKITLNNTTDSARLLDPVGEVKDSYNYDNVEEGSSYNRDGDGWYVVSVTPTPGEENIITVVEIEEEEEEEEQREEGGRVAGAQVKKVLLAKVRDEKVGTEVEVEGVVSVPPGVFGEKIIYLAGSGIQVYFSKEEWPNLKLGDKVSLLGEVSTVRGETRIKISRAEDVQIKEMGGKAPAPHIIKTGAVDEKTEGWLVTIQGHVTQTNGDIFYVDDGSGEAKVYIKETTNINKPKMKKGMAVTVTGVVSETTSGWRLLPRWQEDIRLGMVAGMTSFPATGWQGKNNSELNNVWGLVGPIVVYLLVVAWWKEEALLRAR